jgi:hypothetical protein
LLRVGVVLSVCLAAAACDAPPPEPAAKPYKIVPREKFALPPEERPMLGKVGDTTCAAPDNELLLVTDERACLSVLKDTIKRDTSVEGSDVKLVRLRKAYFQPGPPLEGDTVGWTLYATRVNCLAELVVVLGNVTYTPEGVEISRATPAGGPLMLPDGLAIETLVDGVCGGGAG